MGLIGLKRSFAAAAGFVVCVSYSAPGYAWPLGKHKQTVVQQAPVTYVAQAPTAYVAQAPSTYVAQAPVTYTLQAPAAVAQAQVSYVAQAPVTYAAQAPTTAAAPATNYVYVSQAPATTPTAAAPVTAAAPSAGCTLSADERRDIIEELRAVRKENKDATPSERRQAVKERATELLEEYCEGEPSSALVRNLVSEALGHGPSGNDVWPAGYSGYAQYAPAGPWVQPAAVVPLVPIIPIQFVPAPKHCLHGHFGHCAHCRRGY